MSDMCTALTKFEAPASGHPIENPPRPMLTGPADYADWYTAIHESFDLAKLEEEDMEIDNNYVYYEILKTLSDEIREAASNSCGSPCGIMFFCRRYATSNAERMAIWEKINRLKLPAVANALRVAKYVLELDPLMAELLDHGVHINDDIKVGILSGAVGGSKLSQLYGEDLSEISGIPDYDAIVKKANDLVSAIPASPTKPKREAEPQLAVNMPPLVTRSAARGESRTSSSSSKATSKTDNSPTASKLESATKIGVESTPASVPELTPTGTSSSSTEVDSPEPLSPLSSKKRKIDEPANNQTAEGSAPDAMDTDELSPKQDRSVSSSLSPAPPSESGAEFRKIEAISSPKRVLRF